MPAAAVAPRRRPGRSTSPSSANGTYAVTGATLHPVSGPDIADGTIVIVRRQDRRDRRRRRRRSRPAAKVIDAKGLDVWPGLVDAGTPLGLFEVGSLQETQDSSDSAAVSSPSCGPASALHPDSELIPVTRANGVLAAFVQPVAAA